ncbi:MAG: phosphatidylglycerophosphatase A family protein [Terriglobales bacterium]
MPTAFPRSGTPWQRLQHLLAIAGPIGFIPWAPATWASALVAALCWWLLPASVPVAVITAALFVLGGFCASTSERLLGHTDPRNVVIDELAGQLLTFVFLAPINWRVALAGFVLFRLFDILKPLGIRHLERLPAGWGIMADDLLAGFYAALVLWLLRGLL